MSIRFDQATYGEKDKGHGLLNHTFDDSKIPKSIELKTDLPSGHTSTASWEPFYSSLQHGEYYVIMKTFPDYEAERGAFVFTYAIFIRQKDIGKIKDIGSVFSLLPESLDKQDSLQPIEYENNINIADDLTINEKVKKVTHGILNEENPVIWIGQEGFLNAVRIIWNNLWTSARLKFQFRISFGPKDIYGSSLQMVCTPKGLRDKWDGHFIIKENDSFIKPISPSVKCLIKGIEAVPELDGLVEDMEVFPSSIKDLKRFEDLLDFVNKNTSDGFNYATALTNQLSPIKGKGTRFKNTLVNKLAGTLSNGSLKEILSLRNLSSGPFPSFRSIEKASGEILNKHFFSGRNTETSTKIILSAHNQEVEPWWRRTVKSFLAKSFSNWESKHATFFWKCINLDKTVLDIMEEYIPDNPVIESDLISNFPEKTAPVLAESIANFARKKNWLMLHAVSVTLIKIPLEALQTQLEIDQDDTHFEGFESIAREIPAELFIEFCISNPTSRLISISAKLITESPKLLNKMNVSNPTWLAIWEEAISCGIEPFNGIKKPQKVVLKLIEHLLEGVSISESLMESVSRSPNANLLEYSDRKKIWNSLSPKVRENFIKTTANIWLDDYLLNQASTDIEQELKNEALKDENILGAIKSDKYANKSLISLFKDFNIYKEHLFSSFIETRAKTLDKDDCLRIGAIIKTRQWSGLYRKIKQNLIHQNQNFEETIKTCKGVFPLIDNPLFGTLKSLFSSGYVQPSEVTSTVTISKQDVERKTAVILTAIDVEYNAVKGFLQNYSEENHPSTGSIYGTGTFGQSWNVKVVETEAGNQNAAIEAQRAIEYYKPEYVFFIGLAGGLKDVNIGDIVIASKVYGYESGKADEIYKPRLEFGQPTYKLKEIAKSLRKDDKWLKELNNEISYQLGKDLNIKAHFKPIAAGEKVVSSTKSETYNFIIQNAGDSLAVEMEGIGFLKACYAYENINYILIRGISDLIDNKSKTDQEGSQELASLTAAAFAFEILNRIEKKH